MALIVGIPYQALDGNGEVMPFAEYHTFEADAPTTPKITYADPGLTVMHPNPLPALDDGYFPPMYAQEGDALYIAFTPQNGDPDVPFKAYEQVWAVGGDETTAFERTFADARLRITSGEVESGLDGILIQAGRPSPINTGGYLKEEGWAGTQLDKKIINAAMTEFTGALKVGGTIAHGNISPGFPVALAKVVVTAASTIEIALPAGYDAYTLEIRNFVGSVATAVNLNAQLSFDNAATYKSASGDYMYSSIHVTGSSTEAGNGSVSSTSIPLALGGGGGLGLGGTDVRSEIFVGAARETRLITNMTAFTAGNNLLSQTGLIGGTTNNKGYGRATHIKITPTAGTMSFTYVLIGKP